MQLEGKKIKGLIIVFAILEAKKEMDQITKEEVKLKSEKIDVDEKLKAFDKKLREYNATINSFKSKLGELQLHEIPNETVEALKQFTDEELEERSVEGVEKEMQAAEKHLRAAKPNLNAIKEYRKKQMIFTERSDELSEITNKRTEMRKIYDSLRNRRKDEFITG